MSRSFSLAFPLGALALFMALATLATQAVISQHIDSDSLGQAAAVISAILEAVLLLNIVYLCAPIFVPLVGVQSKWSLGIAFGLGVLICTVATATSILALTYARAMATKKPSLGFIAACSVILVLSFLTQMCFLIVYFLTARTDAASASWAFQKDDESRLPSRSTNIKAIRYSKTLPMMDQSQRSTMWLEPLASPRSVSCRSTCDTIRLSVGSTNQAATRPVSSLSRLLPSRDSERGVSMESNNNNNNISRASSVGGEAFDSWDTSAVDAHNRQAVLEMSSPTQAKGRCLETIPASPTPSRSPSPASLSDLEPPQQMRSRTRSFSPVSLDRVPRPSTPGASGESHIHPLFRSDSPDPHPLASPGTSVLASPDAGKVIMHRASTRSLNRMRSGSLPMTRSPLSRQGSFEDGRSLRQRQMSELDIFQSDEVELRPQTGRTATSPMSEWAVAP